MDVTDFDRVIDETIAALPAWVRDAMVNVEILVLEEPDEMDGDLLGIYIGSPLPEREANFAGELPDVIHIYRQPHLALGLGPAALADEIATTLVHEIAHYFGIDDDRLDELGWG